MTVLAEIFPVRFGGYWGLAPGEAEIDALAIRNGDVGTAGSIDWASLPTRAFTAREAGKALVKAGDILLTTSGNCGNVAFVASEPNMPTLATNFVRVLRVDPEKTHAKFAFHYLRTRRFRDEIAPFVRGATIKNLSVESAFGAVGMPTPPLVEQRRIAAILDQADALRAKRGQALAHLDDLTQSSFHDMFGDPAANPLGHHVRELADWITPGRPITYGILKPGPHVPDGVPYVRVADMKDRGIATHAVRCTTQEIAAAYRRSELRAGDLLMSIRGHVGRFALVPAELNGANITQDSARLAVSEPDCAQYLRAAMESPGLQQWMARRTKGAAVKGINLGDLRALPVPSPPMDQVRRFARVARRVELQRELLRAAITSVDELFGSIQSIAFRGGQ